MSTETFYFTETEREYLATALSVYILKCEANANLCRAANNYGLAAEYDRDGAACDALMREICRNMEGYLFGLDKAMAVIREK